MISRIFASLSGAALIGVACSALAPTMMAGAIATVCIIVGVALYVFALDNLDI